MWNCGEYIWMLAWPSYPRWGCVRALCHQQRHMQTPTAAGVVLVLTPSQEQLCLLINGLFSDWPDGHDITRTLSYVCTRLTNLPHKQDYNRTLENRRPLNNAALREQFAVMDIKEARGPSEHTNICAKFWHELARMKWSQIGGHGWFWDKYSQNHQWVFFIGKQRRKQMI